SSSAFRSLRSLRSSPRAREKTSGIEGRKCSEINPTLNPQSRLSPESIQDAYELRDYWGLSQLNLELIFPQDSEADFQGEISFPSPLMAIETEMGVVIFDVIGMNKLLSVGTRQLTPLDTLDR
ncbi:unnamed protein product, partial [Porites evermanni]